MPTSQQPGKQSFDHLLLSDNYFAYLFFDRINYLAQLLSFISDFYHDFFMRLMVLRRSK